VHRFEGGKWQEEAKWKITPFVVHMEEIKFPQAAIAKGRGLSNCTFDTLHVLTSSQCGLPVDLATKA